MFRSFALAGAAALAFPLILAPTIAVAQTSTTTTTIAPGMATDPDTGTPITQQRAAADAAEKPVTGALNNQVGAHNAAADARNAANQAQYDQDMAQYRASVETNHRDAMRDQRRYRHQQRAFADAMADWRIQNAQCKRGILKACKLPTPDPANYY